MRNSVDLTGKRFGRLVVLEKTHHKNGNVRWKCQCDCGNISYPCTHTLIYHQTVSCGCYLKENYHKFVTKHGFCHTKIYNTWAGMKRRCSPNYDHSGKNYKNYAGRGIKICNEWKNDFLNFYNWAMENGYSDGLTIERIDVNGDYCPENCKWILPEQQARNRRNSVYLEFNGERKYLNDWAKEVGISANTIRQRINKSGWSVEKALTTPLRITKATKASGSSR